MGITKELKSKSLVVNRICYIFTIVVDVVFFISMSGAFKDFIHDAMDTYYSTARSWAVVITFVGIAASILFATLWYYLIKIFIVSKDEVG